ncbi:MULTISPECIES: Chromate resistance protein ChrB [unclassified Rhodococcus (in: high G+C Gram-positive bacteria)]|uniref:Chromate resistance protein ChrB n=1 Tax=unclassified Rhodococcus (in: high G+C Gram-positive bacteria) TaxID=192944 RepID=UPI001EF9FF43|nr:MULTISPECIES: Chromate resistance protein ChrB [unclassified Rhodococcus (in: high G+C Gram-positive bacteria)]
MNSESSVSWRIILIKIAAEPTRHRVAVWRELRKVGALSIGQGTWAVPNVPAFAAGVDRAKELVDRASGEVVFLNATGASEEDNSRFAAMFTAAREEDWTEFLSDCAKYEAELDKEIRIQKFTLAELEEEEQSLDRLRRWHRDLKARDVFGASNAESATAALQHCTVRFEDYSERVINALHSPEGNDDGDPT